MRALSMLGLESTFAAPRSLLEEWLDDDLRGHTAFVAIDRRFIVATLPYSMGKETARLGIASCDSSARTLAPDSALVHHATRWLHVQGMNSINTRAVAGSAYAQLLIQAGFLERSRSRWHSPQAEGTSQQQHGSDAVREARMSELNSLRSQGLAGGDLTAMWVYAAEHGPTCSCRVRLSATSGIARITHLLKLDSTPALHAIMLVSGVAQALKDRKINLIVMECDEDDELSRAAARQCEFDDLGTVVDLRLDL